MYLDVFVDFFKHFKLISDFEINKAILKKICLTLVLTFKIYKIGIYNRKIYLKLATVTGNIMRLNIKFMKLFKILI